MASSELNVGNIDGVEILTPLEDQCLSPLNNTPMDFSLLTTSQLGISPQSFTPSSSRKDKSRLAQLKLKRRSNVGVRGSPETNSLIRYIAQQRMMKTPPATTESISARPSTPRVSKLKQEMAIFQSLLCEEEEEMPEKMPRQENPLAECIKTRKDLSDGRSRDAWKENCPPPMTPLPNKRWCPGLLCEGEIREANAPTLQHSLLKTREDAVDQDRAQLPPGLEVPVSPSPPQPPPTHSPAKEQQDSFPEAGAGPGDAGPPLPPPFCMPSSPEPNRKDGDPSANSAVRKKRVRFGAPLSPEFFDKNLPPSTPLQKGATPARAPPPSAGGSQVRSVLKTPQRSQSTSALPQLDFSSPSGASPPLRRGPQETCVGRGAGADTLGEIAFTVDDSERSLVEETDVTWETQPLDLNAAFREVLFTEALRVCVSLETKASVVFAVDPPSELESDSNPATNPVLGPEPEDVGAPASAPVLGPEPEDVGAPVLGPEPEDVGAPVLGPEPEDVGAPVLGPEPEDVGAPVLGPEPEDVGAPASSNSRKRKQPEEVEPLMKRSTRSAAKSAGVKLKKASARRGWGCKEVDRSLYGSRAYASRDPALSPITETLPSASRSPTPQRPRASTHTDKTQESDPSPALGDVIMAAKLWRQRFGTSTNESTAGAPDPCDGEPETPAPSGALSTRRTPRRGSGPRTETPGRGRGRKVSVPADHWLSEVPEGHSESHSEQPCGDQTAALEDAGSSPPSRTPAQESPPPCPPSGTTDQEADPEQVPVSLVKERPSQRRFKAAIGRSRGRKMSPLPPSTIGEELTAQPGEPQPGEPQPGEGVEGRGRPHGASQAEDDPHSSEGCASDGPDPFLPAWHQLEFSIEDVLRPRASRGQRSVRRSLRNHSSQEAAGMGAGLAWVPHTSPDSLRAVRRKTRGRRGSATLLQPPLQPPLPQELDPGRTEEPEPAH
ncbi:cell division cycle-associated protein 2 [Osmerus mordax]|uniref:cell division cycle-associated protein 2 n=1 Tax=Osmerus mordax TaxID=8014 RepID=UPI00350F8334